MEKSKVLIVGGTGYLGKRLVKASLTEGHETYVLHRPEIGVDIEKVQMLLSFKAQGAHLVASSFDDHRSLVDSVKLVDVVICAISGVHIRSHQILLQLKLVDAIKEAGNLKRFLPSEFGTDPSRMENAMEPGRVTFDDKMAVRKAIQEAGIPFTYVSANCFAGYFLGGLCQPGLILPPRDSVNLLGDGNQKGTSDPQILVANNIWTPYVAKVTLLGVLTHQSEVQLRARAMQVNGQNYAEQVGLTHYFHVCYEGCLTNFEIGDEGEEASKLYPEVKYTNVEDYLKRYI
ncbi:hypothetical protein RJ639_008651 [Escallonia herrerae]|uniref:(+)-lariciresinol reductase n=1 Tax=Escallonia herrerae TaxID=1293975 RepID=A0AA88VU62_9ASTE|nr:hypothetical protein RJ639_008651 [Escallonia herrerae]